MTAKVVDDATDTGSNKTREAAGQGIGNILVGCFGGMAGCAMIGQTMINVKAGARSRLSTFSAGFFLLILVAVFGGVVAQIPMAALVAVMVFVSAVTFDWHSVKPETLRKMPVSETITVAVTVAVTVATHNLAIGVLAGVIVAMVAFARKVAHLVEVTSVQEGRDRRPQPPEREAPRRTHRRPLKAVRRARAATVERSDSSRRRYRGEGPPHRRTGSSVT
nr:hypothetical protein K3N28_01625 [Glycomyces sp. TRM65418]